MSLRLFERLNGVFDAVFGPPAWPPRPVSGHTTLTGAALSATVTVYCGLCGDPYAADSGTWAASPECALCRRARAIERDHERANWRRRRDALLAVAEGRTDGTEPL